MRSFNGLFVDGCTKFEVSYIAVSASSY